VPAFLFRTALKVGDDRFPLTPERIDVIWASLASLFDKGIVLHDSSSNEREIVSDNLSPACPLLDLAQFPIK